MPRPVIPKLTMISDIAINLPEEPPIEKIPNNMPATTEAIGVAILRITAVFNCSLYVYI